MIHSQHIYAYLTHLKRSLEPNPKFRGAFCFLLENEMRISAIELIMISSSASGRIRCAIHQPATHRASTFIFTKKKTKSINKSTRRKKYGKKREMKHNKMGNYYIYLK